MSPRVPPVEVNGVYGAIVKAFSKRKLGQVPESLGVSWNNPDVLKGMFAVSGKVQKWDACDLSLESYAHMAVASMIGCTWCLDFGYFQAHNEDLDLDKAREIPRWRESDVFTPTWRARSPARRSTGCARCPAAARTTSASGCRSRC